MFPLDIFSVEPLLEVVPKMAVPKAANAKGGRRQAPVEPPPPLGGPDVAGDPFQGWKLGVNPNPNLINPPHAPPANATLTPEFEEYLGQTLKRPIDVFQFVFPDNELEQWVSCTNGYAVRLSVDPAPPFWYHGYTLSHSRTHWPVWWVRELVDRPLALPELKAFLGLGLLFGVVRLPKLQDYWSDRIPHVALSVGQVMARDRYRAINSGLQVLDRRRDAEWARIPEYDGLGTYWKIGDYMKRWRERVTSMVKPGRDVTMDETGKLFQLPLPSALSSRETTGHAFPSTHEKC